jgi:hypothetical protein
MHKINENLQWNNEQRYHSNKTYSYNENPNRQTYLKLALTNHQERRFQYPKNNFNTSYRSNQQDTMKYSCFICGQVGHLQAQCSERRGFK